MRRSLAAAVVLAMAFVSAALIARGSDELRSPLTLALGTIPDVTLTANFTDWRQVREAVGATDVSSDDRESTRQRALDAAYDDDLSAVSGLVGSGPAMADPYGWSVLDLDWEIYGQARQGGVIVAELGENVAPDDVTSGLTRLGYAEPDSGADSGGVWRGGPDLVARIDPTLTPLLEHVAVLADPGLIVLSDTPAYVKRTVDTITSESGGMGGLADVAATAAPLDGAITAIVHRPPRACSVTSFETASSSDRALAAARIADVGGLRPHEGLGFAIQPSDRGLELVVAMHFATPATAEGQRAARTDLASGPAIGQGGTYDERFEVVDSEVRDSDLILVLLPVEAHMSLVSDLASSPLLFTGCDG